MANRNIIKNTFNTTSEEQASHLKRTIWNSSMIDIQNKSFNILLKGFDYKMVQEKLPLLEISECRTCNHQITMLGIEDATIN